MHAFHPIVSTAGSINEQWCNFLIQEFLHRFLIQKTSRIQLATVSEASNLSTEGLNLITRGIIVSESIGLTKSQL